MRTATATACGLGTNARAKTIAALVAVADAVKAMLEEEAAVEAIPPSKSDEVLGLREAAAELCEPIPTVRGRCQRGDIKAEKRGKLWKIARPELVRYVERSRRRGLRQAGLRVVQA